MKILQIIDSLETGGAERLIVDTVPMLVQSGHEVDVLLLNGINSPFYKELENLKVCNIYSLGKSYYNPFYIIKIIPFLIKYDIAHVHLFPAQYFVVVAYILSMAKVKLIFTEHNTSNNRLHKPIFKRLEKFIYSKYKKIICITNEVKTELKKELNIVDDKLLVLNNGINIQKINDSIQCNRKDFNLKTDDKILIMVAAFREQKDQDTVIKMMNLLPKKYKLMLVGDGKRRASLEALIKEQKIDDRVFLLGIRSDVFSLYKMADVAILSSHWEGFGLAAAEAMACGIPLIASNVSGLSQVVSGGGLLFEKSNQHDLAKRIISVENETFYQEVIQKGYDKSQQYSIDVMVDRLLKIYKTEYANK